MSLFPKSISTPTQTKSTTRGRNGFKLNNQVNPMTQTITATSHGLFLIIPNKGIPNNNNKHRNGDGLKLGNYIIYAYICISINKSSRFFSRLITAPKLRDFGLCEAAPHHGTVDDLCKFGIQWHLKQDTNKDHVCAFEQQQVLFWF